MAAPRSRRIEAMLAAATEGASGTTPLCEVSAAVVGVTGAGIMLVTGSSPGGSYCTSNPVSDIVEELQFTLGEGPCVDAHQLGRPVLEADLAEPAEPRWLAFTPPALDAGVRAIFGFPLQVGSVRLGALNLYRDRRGPLSEDQHADALAMADIAAATLLAHHAGASAEGRRGPGEHDGGLLGADLRLVVHQAAGMVSVQLGVTASEALVRLRAHAFGQERALTDVADDVVARRLRLD